jgi:hypothetical protein
MYINKLDEFIDKVLDDFFNRIIKLKENLKIISSENFIKQQKEINNILIEYFDKLNFDDIKDLLQDSNKNTIIQTIKKYVSYYIFIFMGYYFEEKNLGKENVFMNNLVEFSKNQSSYPLKIDNFFNSESNSLILDFYKLIKNILNLLDFDKNKVTKLLKNIEYENCVNIYTDLGYDFIQSTFNKKDILEKGHNIVKTLIILYIYNAKEKKGLYNLIENLENSKGEYIYIDIIVPKKKFIDYSTVENVLNKEQIESNLTEELYNFIINSDKLIYEKTIDLDKNILTLINSGVLIPIVEDFMLYNKESEKYDRNILATEDPKKKDDTKLKYIVNKIDMVTDYYSEKANQDSEYKKKIKENFFTPLNEKRAILINDGEEIKIINKLIKAGTKALDENEYITDLFTYRIYPYINFKDFDKDGFSLNMEKTIDCVRSISFDKTGDFRQNERNKIQMRVGSKNLILNIVGFIIPSNKKHTHCLKVRDFINIHDLDPKNKNGYEICLDMITKRLFGDTKHDSSLYWFFDLEKDTVKIDNYTEIENISNSEKIKLILNQFYNDLLKQMYIYFNDILKNKKDNEIQESYKLLYSFLNKIKDNNEDINADLYNSLEKLILYDYSKKEIPKYDEKEDIFFGIVGDIIKLPHAPQITEKTLEIVKLDLSHETKPEKTIKTKEPITYADAIDDTIIEGEDEITGICQHFVSWDNISKLKRKSPQKYTLKVYEFMTQYVIENASQEYVCKSCGTLINIKKFLTDGEFDNETHSFITYSSQIDINLEDIFEYQKYKIAIRSLDKLIEKIAILVNIPNFMGNTLTIRNKRKTLVKDIIDIVLDNNKILRKGFKERNELASKIYNISRNLSQLFIFDLDNNIFVFSSKEKDYYKNIKHNNMLSYLIFLLCLEINESQITFITGDKKGVCNFQVFYKYGLMMFENIKIRINKNGDLGNIKSYPVLCYMIYMMTCMATKYNMWYSTEEEVEKVEQDIKKKYDPQVQKQIIHTIIDILNSILENYSKSDIQTTYIYEVIISKFFKKLNSLFNSEEIIKKFKDEQDKSSALLDKKTYIAVKQEYKILKEYIAMEYDEPKYNTSRSGYYTILKKPNFIKQKENKISNLTNCPDGRWHQFKLEKDTYVCSLCNYKLTDSKIEENKIKDILDNYKYLKLEELAKSQYCLDGTPHNYIYDNQKKLSICTKCKKDEKYKYSREELKQLEKNLDKEKIETKVNVTKETKKDSYEEKVYEKIKEQYNKNIKQNNIKQAINSFVNKLKEIIGTSSISNELDLKNNIYIVDHDYKGNKLQKPQVITEKDNKVSLKKDHVYFKTDVVSYIYKGNIEVFYEAINGFMLGYKESGKDYVKNKNTELKLIINYSTEFKLNIIGYESRFINIQDIKEFLYYNYGDKLDKETIKEEIIKTIISNRINNIKKILYEFQRFLNRIKNNYIPKPQKIKEEIDENYLETTNEVEIITNKYIKKLSNINLYDNKGEHKIFKHWKAIVNKINISDFKELKLNIDIDNDYINSEELYNYDVNGNILLYYILSEIDKLFEYNQNKIIQTNIVNYLVDFINITFEMFNIETKLSNIEIKRFLLSLKSSEYIYELENYISEFNTEGMYSDPTETKTKEEIKSDIDAQEEEDARLMDDNAEIEPGDDMETGYQMFYRGNDDLDINEINNVRSLANII